MTYTLSMILSLSLSTASFASSAHKAHSHGDAHLAIAAQGKELQIELESPSESILGFEHKAKSPAELAKIEDIKRRLAQESGSFITLATELGCKLSNSSLDHEAEQGHEHSDVKIKLSFSCQKELRGTSITVNFIKAFPKLKKIKTQVLSEKTFGVTITKATHTIGL